MFGYHYCKLTEMQYMLLGLFVKMNVENVNVINTYVMESNIRIRTFEAILSSDSNSLKESLISNNLI